MRVLAVSLLAGLLSAAALVAGPFANSAEAPVTGAILSGFALGWALLALLSARFTDRPQTWARVPAAVMGLSGAGLILFAPGPDVLTGLSWVWPPLLAGLVLWMAVNARRTPASGLHPWLLYPVFAVLGIVAVGGAYETVANATGSAAARLDGGRLVDVGGHRVDVRCTGTGGPTVVLEPGLGEAARTMARWIEPDLAQATTVCVYDRAGHGGSDPAPAGGSDPARDLHVLLERVHAPGPYVLAGHSLGGPLVLDYARRYPAEVGGVALVDSMHPRQHNAFAGADPLLATVPTLARVGVARLLLDAEDGEPTAQAAQLTRDIEQMPSVLDRAEELESLGDKPLLVVSAGAGYAAGWPAQQDDLAALSSTSVHRTIAGATHASLVDDEADAHQSSRAILDVVTRVRKAAHR